jgi:aryl-alcohol dehydrogenase-like predicted oxidoreductase
MTGQQSLADILPGIIIGGGVFNTQMNDDISKLPVADIIYKAFTLGINAIDTSPYYGPSEELIGRALKDPRIATNFNRSDYILMTKVGRLALDEFNYSRKWVVESVMRSLHRLGTDYLDTVYCHDVEFVSYDGIMEALDALYQLQRQGIVRFIGVSGYPPEVLSKVIYLSKEKFGKAPDVVQNYCHFCLQNTTLKDWVDHWKVAGVGCIINSSPLSMSLLSGRPTAKFHPAPSDLRDAASKASEWCKDHSTTLADVSLKFAIGRWKALAQRNGGGVLINGMSYVTELDHVVSIYSELTRRPDDADPSRVVGIGWPLDEVKLAKYEPTFEAVRAIFGSWINYSWESGIHS